MSTLSTTNLKNPSSGSNNIVLATDGSTTITTLNGTTITGTSVRGVITSGTAVASTSGTAIDFTGIPSWVKRVTVMFNGVSTNGTSDLRLQVGSGSVTTAGYASSVCRCGAAANFYVQSASAAAFQLTNSFLAADVQFGQIVIANITSNTWTLSANISSLTANSQCLAAGSIALTGTLDRIRITTANGTDTFDAGSINILYEG